jgi:hypothetical protein
LLKNWIHLGQHPERDALSKLEFDGDEEKGLAFLRQYHPTLFPTLLDDSRFNRRRRDLWSAMETLRCYFRDAWRAAHPLDTDVEQLRVIDSAPIPICTYPRGSRCRSIPFEYRDDWFGVCTSKKTSSLALVVTLPSSWTR